MIPIMSRMPDGTLLIETDLSAFQKEFDVIDSSERLKLPDGRLAVKRPDLLAEGFTVLTVHPEVWERMKSAAKRVNGMKEYLNRFEKSASRGRTCRRCGSELRAKMEMEGWWAFKCRTCEHREVWGKTLVGGTSGAGEKEKI